MSADDGSNKYSVLPFLDCSGKDVFEAGEDNPNPNEISQDENVSEDIERTSIDQKNSFNVFKDKYVDSSGIDFSDRIHQQHKSGYGVKTVYEMLGEQYAKETPQQKYQRLQHELNELAQEVSQIQAESDASAKENSSVELSKQVKVLESKLHDLHLEKVLGTETVGSSGSQQGSWSKDISNQLKAFEARAAGTTSVGDKDTVEYKIFCKPEHSKFTQSAKLSELEAKVKSLEGLLGNDNQKLQNIIADPTMPGSSLMDSAANLHTKVQLLDLQHIEIVAARLQGLLHCINEVSQKKGIMEDTEKKTKVTELHDIVNKWNSVASTVPDVVERLKALKGLHDQASNFSQSLEHVTASQDEVRDQLRTQNDTLDKFEKSLTENVLAIQSNCSNLESRIQAVMKKVGEA